MAYDGVEKDDGWAAFWYEMAGQQGDAQAQFSTGWFYMTGTGVKQDKRMGLKWIHKATAQGFEYAKKWFFVMILCLLLHLSQLACL